MDESVEMQKFLEALAHASEAMRRMTSAWEDLPDADDDVVQGASGWGEAFCLSLDEVPLVMWGVYHEIKDRNIVKGVPKVWDECNALQGGWGESDEYTCKTCTMVEMDAHGRDEDGSLDIDDYLSNCHRGGYVPVEVHGVKCDICGMEVK
jgi:hypothetical protein